MCIKIICCSFRWKYYPGELAFCLPWGRLKKIVDKKYSYVFVSRLKSMKEDIKQEIFNEDGYRDLGEIRYKVIDYINKVKVDNTTYELSEN